VSAQTHFISRTFSLAALSIFILAVQPVQAVTSPLNSFASITCLCSPHQQTHNSQPDRWPSSTTFWSLNFWNLLTVRDAQDIG
jgi:hypothetical protein